MAAFYKYICRFESCQKVFTCLIDLIDHIEYIHIIRDPIVLKKQEQSQPASIALSYVNCFFSEHFRDDRPIDDVSNKVVNKDAKLSEAASRKPSNINKADALNDSFDSSLDDTDTFSDAGSDDSSMSWSTNGTSSNNPVPDTSVQSLLSCLNSTTTSVQQTTSNNSNNNSNNSSNNNNTITAESLQGKFTCLEDSEGKKRFLCTVPGCEKKYKNINGIKYHVKNGHNKKDGLNNEVKKRYTCHCGKAYKSQSGLRHHQTTQHTSKVNQQPTSSSYSPVSFDVRMDNNFKQPQPQLKQQQQVQSLPPVAEMYQPQTPISPNIVN